MSCYDTGVACTVQDYLIMPDICSFSQCRRGPDMTDLYCKGLSAEKMVMLSDSVPWGGAVGEIAASGSSTP